MANRQDSGSNSAQENERPTSQNEDALPEMTEGIRGSAADESDDEFDEADEEDDLEEGEDEGNI